MSGEAAKLAGARGTVTAVIELVVAVPVAIPFFGRIPRV